MKFKKLVELNGELGGWMEVDPVKLRRVAIQFRDWLSAVDPGNDPFGFLTKDLPLVQMVLEKCLQLPYRGQRPHSWELREDLLPAEYTLNSAEFYNTIRGALREPPVVIKKNGRFFAWAEWEQPEE